MSNQTPDHKEDFSRIPDNVLADLAVEECLMDCEFYISTPDGIDTPDKWDLLREATLDATEWVDEYGLLVYLSTTFDHQYETHRATRLNPAEYDTVEMTAEISITWSMAVEDTPDVHMEFYE